MKLVTFLLMFFLMATSANAGPFGTNMNDDIKKYRNLGINKDSPTLIDASTDRMSMPKSHPRFPDYNLKFFKGKLIGVAAVAHAYRYGYDITKLREIYDEVLSQLCNKYGKFDINQRDENDFTINIWENIKKDNISLIVLGFGEKGVVVEFRYNNYTSALENEQQEVAKREAMKKQQEDEIRLKEYNDGANSL